MVKMLNAVFSFKIHLRKEKKIGEIVYTVFEDGETPREKPKQNKNENLCLKYFLVKICTE